MVPFAIGENSLSNQTQDENAGHFGFQDIDPSAKQGLVDDVFSKVAKRYDLMNDLMSGGLHRLWKDAAINWLAPNAAGGTYRHIDVAGGTGDMAFRIADAVNGRADIQVLDINNNMLGEGKIRARNQAHGDVIDFVQGNAESLPFPDKWFDSYTIAFGLRNVPNIGAALQEAFRVLKTGGRFICLEFSHPSVPMLDKAYDLFSFKAIPALGSLVSGDADSYRYLVESIRKFPDQETLVEKVVEAGFSQVKYRNLSGGIAAIHSGWRI